MTVRLLRLGTHGYSWVVLTISIKAVFLPVLCPALLRFVASRRYQDYCYPKNAASAANIRISARSFHDCEPHRRFFMFSLLACLWNRTLPLFRPSHRRGLR